MYRLKLSIVSTFLILLIPGSAGPGTTASESDPYEEVVAAIEQGRHWYAARLLDRLERRSAREPEIVVLAAQADAGRGAWDQVTRRLSSVGWLDSLSYGEPRALVARAWLEQGREDRALDHYNTFLSYSVAREPRALAEIGRARALAELGYARESADAYGRAAELAPEIKPWLSVRVAESLAGSGDTAAVRRYLSDAEDIPLWRRSRARAEAHRAAGDSRRAVSLFLRAANSATERSEGAALRTEAAKILLSEMADTAAAIRTLRTAVRLGRGYAREAADLFVLMPGLKASDHLHAARTYERAGHRTHAVTEYREYMNRVRMSRSQRQNMQMKIAELLFRARWYTASIDELETLVESRPPRALAARAEYYIARATYRRGLRGGGRARLRSVADRYSGTSAAINALFTLADVYESAGMLTQAKAAYEEVAKKYPWTQTAGRSRFRLGIMAFMDGDYAEARAHFDRCRQAFRTAELRTRATYWAARAREAEGGERLSAEAMRLFRQTHARDPFGYYGLLAAERADIDPWINLPPGPEPEPVDSATLMKFESIDLLRRAGLDDEAEHILETILASRPRSPEANLGLAEVLAEYGFGRDAVRYGWRAHARSRGRWSASVLRAIYPLTYSEILIAESRHHRLDPHLLAAVVRQESAFAYDVTSHAGARGLLQIMPPTGRWWAARLGVRDYSDELLFHPETNVHLGAAYLSDLNRRYNELQLSLVAYNAGPTRARRWRESKAYQVGPEIFAERIPFTETRNYVRGIQTQLRIYRYLYSEFGSVAPTTITD